MHEYKAPVEDIQFLLHDVFNFEEFCSKYPDLADLDKDTANAIIEEASKLSEQLLAPLNAVGHQQGCKWEDGVVTAAAGFKEAYAQFSEGAWGALGGNPEYGGMGMPKTLVSAVEEMVQGSNMSFGLAPMLTAGACLSMNAHASEELKAQYLPKMYSGEWSGAMDLTEAHSGSDLGLMRTKAEPREDGSYSVSGTKIFITWGEHDMAENIVHLVLARLPDAPKGSRGISMLLVPKLLPQEDGSLIPNEGVSCGSIEHKMGINASPTCVMNFDGAKGWLVGEAHKGLAYMFTMMNYERLVVGIQGVSLAEHSYQCARDYALDRLQGRGPSAAKASEKEADPIIEHPDVRRMLLEMKAMNEASRAFYLYVAQWLDRAKFSDSDEEKAEANDRVALLTPVTKAFITDRAFDTCVHGQQVLGGHGYVQEWGQEQHVRDVRITQIYEGTNGIQAMDLIGRKTIMEKGRPLKGYLDEIRRFIADESSEVDGTTIESLSHSLKLLEEVSDELINSNEPSLPGSVACDYLDLLGYCSFGYMWLRMMATAKVQNTLSKPLSGKYDTGRFYFAKLLPRIESLVLRIRAGQDTVMALSDDQF